MPLGAFRLNSLSKRIIASGRTAVTVTAVGNAQVDTAQSKFGGSSALFDGNGDYLDIASSSALAVGTGNFTVEMWVRFNAVNDQQVFWDNRNELDSTPNGWIWYIINTNKMAWYDGTYYEGTTSFTTGVWYHIAASRSGTTLRFYINGVLEMTQTNSANNSSGKHIIGTSFDGGAANSTNGWIDEVRFSNTARYTANFTAPTAAFTNDTNTLLLLHMNGTDGSTTFTDDNT